MATSCLPPRLLREMSRMRWPSTPSALSEFGDGTTPCGNGCSHFPHNMLSGFSGNSKLCACLVGDASDNSHCFLLERVSTPKLKNLGTQEPVTGNAFEPLVAVGAGLSEAVLPLLQSNPIPAFPAPEPCQDSLI